MQHIDLCWSACSDVLKVKFPSDKHAAGPEQCTDLNQINAGPVVDQLRYGSVIAAIELLELDEQAPGAVARACLHFGTP